MAYTATDRALIAASQKSKTPNLIFVIDGAPRTYAVLIPKTPLTYDSGYFYDDPELFYDGLVDLQDVDDYISLTGTSDTVQQQLEPDKGAASSTGTMNVKLVDFNNEITRLITPGLVLPDVLYRNAKLLLGFSDTVYPTDYIELFNGKITALKSEPGSVTFTVSHPDEIKRSDIFVRADTTLTQNLNFRSSTIQDLFYRTRSDVVGIVDVTYVNNPGMGNNANVSVVGNSISIQIETGVTTAKKLKQKIEAHEEANQLVAVIVTGTPTNTQIIQSQTFLNSDTTIHIDDASQFLSPVDDVFFTYARIEDEIIQYTGIDLVAKTLTGCTREALNTLGASHDINKEVFSFYKLGDATFDNGNSVDLALYVLLSGAPSPYVENVDIESFVHIDDTISVANAIYFQGVDAKARYGLTAGSSTITVTGAASGANNITDREILSIVVGDNGTYVVVDGAALVSESASSAVASFKTVYNILPDGAGLVPYQVDVDQFESIKATFASSIARQELYIKDTTNSKDFVNKKIFLPSSLYSLPRKGRVSLGITTPSLYGEQTKVLTMDEVKKPSQIDLNRSIQKNFYNAIVYKYNEDSLEDTFLSSKVRLSGDSVTRIDAPTKAFKIEAGGIRPGTDTTSLLDINARRFLQRYQYGAESIPIEVTMEVGWTMEVGDSVIISDPDLQISNTKTGDRSLTAVMYEITNKSYNWRTGQIKLELTNTSFGIDVRYGTWSPSSLIGTGSTTSSVVITDSFGTESPRIEKDKWDNYIGKQVRVHSADYSVSGLSFIDSFDPNDPYKMILNPALSFSPSSGYLVNIPSYDNLGADDEIYKIAHLFWDPTLTIVTGISSTQFTVSIGDAAKLFVNGIIRVHSSDYTIDSGITGIKVTDITGVTITVASSLGFTPAVGQKIDLVGFASDSGAPYAWI